MEAVLAGFRCYGFDLNPLAVAIARAKVQDVDLEDVLYRINELSSEFYMSDGCRSIPEDVRLIFHDRTLAQLQYLREVLDGDREEDVFIKGAVLGILHGKHRKGGGTSYLSIDMPNTFSMSPAYVSRFVAEHGLEKPAVDVFAQLKRRVSHLLRDGSLRTQGSAEVFCADAVAIDEEVRRRGLPKADLIISSPPYLGVLRYGAFNWIRLWFLNVRAPDVDAALDSTDSLDRYLSFMCSFLLSTGRAMVPGGVAVFVIGDVVEHGQHLALAERFWQECAGLVPFELVSLDSDEYDIGSKTTRIWGEGRKGRATPRDHALTLRFTG